jgi:hypothetical protein
MNDQDELRNSGLKEMTQDGVSILNTDINKISKKTKPLNEADADIIQLRIVKKNNAKRKTRFVDLGSHKYEHEYVLYSHRVERNNLVFWTIIYTPTGMAYEFETDQIIKRLDILGKMPVKDTVCIAFSAGMKCVLQEAEIQKKFGLKN